MISTQVYFGGLKEIGIYPEFLLYSITANFQKQIYVAQTL
jgi:hypothetical protein